MTNLVQRTISGAVYVAVVVAAILVHPLAFAAIFAVVSTLAVREFHSITGDPAYTRVFGMLLNLLLFAGVGVWQFCDSMFVTNYIFEASLSQAFALAYIVLLMVALLCELAHHQSGQPAAHWGNLLSGQVMIALPFATMLIVLAYSKWLLLALFVLLWTNDTGAYCVGSLTANPATIRCHPMSARRRVGKVCSEGQHLSCSQHGCSHVADGLMLSIVGSTTSNPMPSMWWLCCSDCSLPLPVRSAT